MPRNTLVRDVMTTDVLSFGPEDTVQMAAEAMASGVPVVIARFRIGALGKILDGKDVGTYFHANATKLTSRKAWIGYATTASGRQ